MTKWRPVLIAIAIVLCGMLYVRACWEPSIRADERRRAGDRGDDSAIARLAAREVERERASKRERDSTGRVIARLQQRIAGGRPATPQTPVRTEGDSAITSADEAASAPLLLRDSLIASLLSGRQQDSLQLLFWKAQVAARDSIIPRLQGARDDARRQAAKPRHTLTDILGGAALGYGLADKNEIAAATGGALILVPRVVDVLGRVF